MHAGEPPSSVLSGIPGRPALAGRPRDPDRGAVDPFRSEAEIMRDGHRRPAGGRAIPSMPASSRHRP
jgi:predicted methyltransferase